MLRYAQVSRIKKVRMRCMFSGAQSSSDKKMDIG